MSDSQRQSTISRLGAETDRLTSDLRELLAAHVQLARLEAKAATRAAVRVAALLGIAVTAALSGIATLVVLAADILSESTSVSLSWWLLILGMGLLLAGCAVGLLGRSRFRGEIADLRGTFEELREDAYWLGQWFGQRDEPESGEPS